MKSLFLFTVLILATIVAHPTAHAEGDKLACETALAVRIGPEELDKHCAECVLSEKALSPKLAQVSELTSLPISADADFLRIAVLLKKSQIGTYSQLNFFEAQISNAKLKVSAQKMLVELYQAFAKDFDGESIRNATRITELTQRRDALMLAMQTATPDPMVTAEKMSVQTD